MVPEILTDLSLESHMTRRIHTITRAVPTPCAVDALEEGIAEECVAHATSLLSRF